MCCSHYFPLPHLEIHFSNAVTGQAFKENVDAQCLTAGDKRPEQKKKKKNLIKWTPNAKEQVYEIFWLWRRAARDDV